MSVFDFQTQPFCTLFDYFLTVSFTSLQVCSKSLFLNELTIHTYINIILYKGNKTTFAGVST